MRTLECPSKSDASTKTKYHMVKGMKSLMNHKPLEAITVREIVAEANVTRQTFYRHFRDKYDLVNWYFDHEALKTIYAMGQSCSLQEGLTGKFQCMVDNKIFFMSAFKCSGCNSLIDYDVNLIYNFYKNVIDENHPDVFDDELDYLLKHYSHGAVAMIVQWSTTGMRREPTEMAAYMIDAFPPKLRILIEDLEP